MDVRVVKEADSRPAGESRMGSSPIPCNRILQLLHYNTDDFQYLARVHGCKNLLGGTGFKGKWGYGVDVRVVKEHPLRGCVDKTHGFDPHSTQRGEPHKSICGGSPASQLV